MLPTNSSATRGPLHLHAKAGAGTPVRAASLTLGLALLASSPLAPASPELARAKNCLGCHALDRPVVGPSFKAVAAKYTNDKGAASRLADKIVNGGTGVWGVQVMPANPRVNPDEARLLAKWVLTVK